MIKGIIVEGCDCSGKTTLVNALKVPLSRSGWDIAVLGHREEPQFDRYMRAYTNADKVIFDRGHFSEIVFGNLWRGGTALSLWEQSFLNTYVFENFLVIFVQAPASILKDRYNARSYDQTITQEELGFVQSQFSVLLEHSLPNVFCYDSSKANSLEYTVNKVLDLLDLHGLKEDVVKKQQVTPFCEQKTCILLEGPNGSGKSTLSKLLKVSMVGWGVKTLDYKPINPFQRYLHEYSNNSEIIFDRGHFSEIVYGNIFRGGKHFSSSQLKLLNEYIKNRGIVVLCNPPVEVLASRVANTEYPKHIHESRLEQVSEEFKKAVQSANIPYHLVDTSNKDSVHEVIRSISQSLSTKPYAEMGWEKPKETCL